MSQGTTASWTAYDDGYLRAWQWAGALAAGTALPRESPTIPLGPGEVAHARVAPVQVTGYFGENKGYRPSLFLFGGPVGLAVTGAVSLARNADKKAEAKRAAVPRWHELGTCDLVMTNQRLALRESGGLESLWYAELGPVQLTTAAAGAPAVQVQPANLPLMRLASPWAPLLYVFVRHLLDGRPPAVPLPAGLLERARSTGRLTV